MRKWVWGAGAAWVVTVVVGASLAWLAIDRAGSQVTTSTTATAPATGSAVISAPSTAPAATGPAGAPTRRPAGGDPPGTASTSSAPAIAAPSSRPSNQAPSRPRATPTTSATGAAPTRTPAPVPRFGTWNGEAGSVTVSCTGSQGRFEGATPADGWRVERKSSSEVRVVFERNETEVEVRARCTSSGPAFEVRTDVEEDD